MKIPNRLEKVLMAGLLAIGLSFGAIAIAEIKGDNNALYYSSLGVSALAFAGRSVLENRRNEYFPKDSYSNEDKNDQPYS